MQKQSTATGVYAIRNTVNGKRYIGSTSKSFKYRWNRHLSALRRGKHHSRHLQCAWNKHGEDAFLFEILLICAKSDCIMYEQRCIDAFKCVERNVGYNNSPTAGSPAGVKHTQAARDKMSAAHFGRIVTQAARDNMSAAQRGKKHSQDHVRAQAAAQRGKENSPETRAKISAAMLGRKRSPEVRAAMSASRRGRKLPPRSAETRANMSAAQRGRKQPPITPETRAKISTALRGRKFSMETLAKMSAAQKCRQSRARMDRQLALESMP